MTAFRLQDPDEKLTYSVEWSPWLATGDTIASASWAITPTGPTVVDLGESGTVVSASVDGPTRGAIYRLTCDMVSANGETGQQSIAIRCDHK
jgi:hypothetical protein